MNSTITNNNNNNNSKLISSSPASSKSSKIHGKPKPCLPLITHHLYQRSIDSFNANLDCGMNMKYFENKFDRHQHDMKINNFSENNNNHSHIDNSAKSLTNVVSNIKHLNLRHLTSTTSTTSNGYHMHHKHHLHKTSQVFTEKICLSPKLADNIKELSTMQISYSDATNEPKHTNSHNNSNDTARKRLYRICLNTFNRKPIEGINLLVEKGFLEANPTKVASFLANRKGLSRTKIGEYLGSIQNSMCVDVIRCLLNRLDFHGLEIDEALRSFLSIFRIPGEAQKIEKIMELFSKRYADCNPNTVAQFQSKDTVFILAYAIIMLNTDLHNTTVKSHKRMKMSEFVKNLKGLDEGYDIPKGLLCGIYERIKKEELMPDADHVTQVWRLQQAIILHRPNLALSHRRLVCYCRLYELPDFVRAPKSELTSPESIFNHHKTQHSSQKAHYHITHPHLHQREVFLFNDLLVLCKIISEGKLQKSMRGSAPSLMKQSNQMKWSSNILTSSANINENLTPGPRTKDKSSRISHSHNNNGLSNSAFRFNGKFGLSKDSLFRVGQSNDYLHKMTGSNYHESQYPIINSCPPSSHNKSTQKINLHTPSTHGKSSCNNIMETTAYSPFKSANHDNTNSSNKSKPHHNLIGQSTTYSYKSAYALHRLSVEMDQISNFKYLIKIYDILSGELILALNAKSEHDRTKFVEDLKEAILENQIMREITNKYNPTPEDYPENTWPYNDVHYHGLEFNNNSKKDHIDNQSYLLCKSNEKLNGNHTPNNNLLTQSSPDLDLQDDNSRDSGVVVDMVPQLTSPMLKSPKNRKTNKLF